MTTAPEALRLARAKELGQRYGHQFEHENGERDDEMFVLDSEELAALIDEVTAGKDQVIASLREEEDK